MPETNADYPSCIEFEELLKCRRRLPRGRTVPGKRPIPRNLASVAALRSHLQRVWAKPVKDRITR